MTVVMGAIVTQFADNLPDAFAIVILGGMLQILFGLLRVGRYVSYTPYSVVSGFMSGIGVIIVLIQVWPFAGLGSVPGGPLANIWVWPEMLTEANTDALLIAGAFHAVVLLALVLGLGPIAAAIPHAALAGILMKIGWDIIDWGYLKHFRHAPRDKLLVMFVTLVLTVFVDLITAVAVGLILAGFVTARWMEAEELKGITQVALPGDDTGLGADELTEIHKANGDVGLLSLRGRFSYASVRELAQAVPHASPRYKVMIYDFTDTAHVDTSAAISIAELISEAGRDEGQCFVTGLSEKTEETLRSLGALDGLPEAHVILNRLDAIRQAVALVAG